ncbi:MAG TPA: HAD family hydrolase [Pseudomonadota bacterium]|jgi:HAD superfamily hydrolase (TIGR01490 family)|nr:HAD family hydrolase [Pseudomonadota bacterium]HNF96710.1 HAD family hydrolase [Pseudomonadota bacterium]HNN51170.1 HAD family hydrolase [Pseudomonadota bacterium]
MARAAFFDMDLTLLRVNSGSRWVKYLRKRGEIGLPMLIRSGIWLLQYRLSLLDMESVAAMLAADMAGDSEADTRHKVAEFYRTELQHTISPDARAQLDQHRQDGDAIVLLTSATPYVAEPLAAELSIPHVLCTRLAIENGRFSGRVMPPACYGSGKVHHAEQFAKAHGIDLAQSSFYTDSYSDLPMLLRVGRPVAVNPDRRLLRYARRQGWPTLRW